MMSPAAIPEACDIRGRRKVRGVAAPSLLPGQKAHDCAFEAVWQAVGYVGEGWGTDVEDIRADQGVVARERAPEDESVREMRKA